MLFDEDTTASCPCLWNIYIYIYIFQFIYIYIRTVVDMKDGRQKYVTVKEKCINILKLIQ